MTKFSSPDKNWREDYKQFTSDKRDLKRLEEGAKSLARTQTVFGKVRAAF